MSKILVIEDEIPILEDILELLSAEGFDAVGAESGQAGIELAQQLLPDLIICDVLMPGLDGHNVLSLLRENPSTCLIPFIFLTAKSTEFDLRQGMNLGADDYLTKPYKQFDLLSTIVTRLNKQNAILKLKQKIEELEQYNLLKDEFLMNVVDELRSPITNIIMATQMLYQVASKDSQERQQRYLELLQTECSREIKLINNLLELQKLATHTRPLRVEPIRLQDWIPAIIEPIHEQAQKRQQLLQVSTPPYLPTLSIDIAALKQILEELLMNACLYTKPKGRILLEVYRSANPSTSGTKGTMTLFSVSNEAEIPAAVLPQIFNQFYRIPGSGRRRQGGSGLGLTLVKKLVEYLHGTIDVTSEAGWTQFLVQIPTDNTT